MFLDYLIPLWLTYVIYIFLLVTPAMISTYLHIRLFGLTLIAVTVVVYLLLTYAYISFFCFLAGLGTIHLIYIAALRAEIASFIEHHNAHPKPFRWTKSADDTLSSIERFCAYNLPTRA